MPLRHAALLAAALAPLAAPGALAQGAGAICGDPGVRPETAVANCRRALDRGGLDPALEGAFAANLGGAFLELDSPRQAEEAYARAVAADPRLAPAWSGLARAREALGQAGLAAVAWNRAADLAPADPDILTGRGAFRLRAGNVEGALADFDAAQRSRPRDMALAFNRGLALAALGRDDEAERMFTAVIRENPDDVGAWLNRARIRVSRDRQAALSDFDEAVARAGEWPTPVFERGVLLQAMGRDVEADRDFRRAWELGERNEYLNARMLEMGG